MEEINERVLDFVVRYYQEGRLNTVEAIKTFKRLTHENATPKSVRRYVAIAASLLILIGMAVGWGWLNHQKETIIASAENVETHILPDGTTVMLSPHSSIVYNDNDIRHGKRTVRLRGKAFFEVKQDANHPFNILGNIGHVKVLGTRFQFEELDDSLARVVLIDGKIDFSSSKSGESVILTEGMAAELLRNSTTPRLISPKNRNETTWATKVFTFEDAPISDVLSQISSYYGVRLTTSDSSKRVSGEFEAGRLEDVIELLEDLLGIKIEIER